ncbi:hypothetical protein OKW98_18710 [Pseudomonas sp. KU26590]|uniref:hypothetical protein n=1 Tax=Pseudomonas sp. KU26590 TaxID=2991051 RepID=UPI00223E5C9E|nr:hypothetical protein [Pseudomonas sp. KU26590]UZJ58610.1 hypothetical protein OKW98_18710 [Pseudomonas sp. KU26590]
MSKELKTAPLEPTREMLSMGSVSCLGKLDHESIAQLWQAMLAAAPVPPAGDVEVLGWRVESHSGTCRTNYIQRPDWAYREDPKVYSITELVDRSEVTRLTAEREELTSRLGAEQSMRLAMERLADKRQAELTKARELLAKDRVAFDTCTDMAKQSSRIAWYDEFLLPAKERLREYFDSQPATPITHNVDESCGQDAEAAKGKCLDCFAVREAEQNPNTECDSCGWLKP